MLSHKNILSNVKNSFHCFDFCSSDGRMLSFLPLNHIFERMVLYLYLTKGVSIYFAESMEKIGDNLREVKPHIFTTVPRLLEKVYERIETKGNELKGISKRIFTWAMKLALKYELKNRGIVYNIQLALADKLVYKKWREAIGGEVLAIVTGSAACQIKLIRAFTAARIIIMEGYGLTETSPVISVNTFEAEGRRFGTVGRQIKNVEVKISEDGEIVFKGDNVMYGYYKNPEATAEVLMNGWLHTGDIGQMDEEGFIRITDRKKELFKMSSGKYIAPLPLENKIKESPYIEQIMVVGSNEKYVGALIVPSLHNVRSYFNRQGILLEDDMDIAENVEVKKLIRGEIDEYNKEFADHERVKRFELLAEEWSIDRGEMTPKLSLKRKVVTEKYKFLIDKIYNN